MKQLLILCLVIFSANLQAQDITVSSDYPGGNIVVLDIQKDTIKLAPDLKHTEGDWFYWNFKVENIAGRKITFQFDSDNKFAKYGPAYSINNDQHWKWLGENSVQNNSFTFTFSESDSIAYFCMSFPYTESHLKEFLDRMTDPFLQVDTLCLSPENRVVEKIRIMPHKELKAKVLITARHHACEMIASYVLEGLMESILSEINLQYLRDHAEFLIIPFMDKDGVENGEQGKNRLPRDHNRDYIDTPVHNSTAALRELAPSWGEDDLKMALDIHCPWIKGDGNEYAYLVGTSDKQLEDNQKQFSKMLETNAHWEIQYKHQNFMKFGVAWNTGKNYTKGIPFAKWANSLKGMSMAATLEFPYAEVSGTQVSKDGARAFGKALAYSMQEYLQTL